MLTLTSRLYERLIATCRDLLPAKVYGVITGKGRKVGERLYRFYSNLRPTDPYVDSLFNSYGEFYQDKDRGFWVSPEELLKVFNKIHSSREHLIAIYHSHRCLGPIPSIVDIRLYRYPEIPMLIISVVSPRSPVAKAFRVTRDSYCEIPINLV
jgi:proteasome lid subunit RPN8/RPN11